MLSRFQKTNQQPLTDAEVRKSSPASVVKEPKGYEKSTRASRAKVIKKTEKPVTVPKSISTRKPSWGSLSTVHRHSRETLNPPSEKKTSLLKAATATVRKNYNLLRPHPDLSKL